MRRFRQKILVYCALIAITAAATALCVSLIFGAQNRKLKKQTEEMGILLENYQVTEKVALCASRDIEAGEAISEEDLKTVSVFESMIPDNTLLTITGAVGKTAKIPINENTYITEGMLYDGSPLGTERAVEYSCIELNGNITLGSFVDVRICFDDGSDYVVLAKKRVEDISPSKGSVILYVDAKELLVMGSAVSEMKASEGCRIYAVAYPQGDIQKAANADYVPLEAVSDIIAEMED